MKVTKKLIHKSRVIRTRMVLIGGLAALVAAPSLLEAAGAAGQPNICTRSCWSARAGSATEMDGLNRAVIHHTAGSGDYNVSSIEDSKAKVRAIQNLHMDSNGWSDIGYHFLVDKLGNTFEGRVRSINKSYRPRGAHDGTNYRSFGFNVMGYYHSPYNQTFTTASRNALWDVIAWRMPNGWSPYGSGSYNGKTVGYVAGHRDVKSTSCPGDGVYATIGTNYNGGEARNAINDRIQGADDRLDVVVRGDSNRIYWRSFWRNNGGWGSWVLLNGAAQEKPGISSRGPGQLEVFIRGGGNDINWRYLSNGSWSAWATLGGPLASGISAVSRSPDRINIVARGTNNEVQHKWWTPSGWSAFQSLGGWTAHTPSISARDSNHLDVFIRGGAGDLNWRAWNSSSGWAGWTGLGGTLASGPSAVSRSSDRINVVARTSDNSIIHKFWTPSGWASNWENLGGGTLHDPGIGSWSSARLDVVITGGGGDINQRYFDTTNGWSGWTTLGTVGSGFTAGPEAVGGQW